MSIFIFGFSIYLSYFLTKRFIPILNNNLSQNPNERSLHLKPTPTGGGIFFVLITTIISSFNNYYYFLIFLPLSLIGFYDDKSNLSPIIRYLVQLITVAIIIFFSLNSGTLSFLNNYLSPAANIIIIFILLIVGTAIINFINFMDGIDGLVAGSSIIFLSSSAIFFNRDMTVIIGSLIGFLILNWNPARIFMGDVGSTFLGALIFSELLQTKNYTNSFVLLLIISPLIFDASSCVIRRFCNNQNIFKPHKLHLYQRLCRNGISHGNVSMIYISASLLISLSYIINDYKGALFSSIIILMIGLVLEQKIALPFKSK